MGDYTIGEMADMLGLSTKTLRHWEARGLLEPSRTYSGYRMYSDSDVVSYTHLTLPTIYSV